MNVVKEVAKTKVEALNKVLIGLNAQDEEVIYSIIEVKGGLFKGISYECQGFLRIDLLNDAVDYLKEIIKGLGIEADFEVTTKDNITTIKMYSSNNPMLIGKDGKNLEALTILVRQYIRNVTFNGPRIVLDVEDYKDRQLKKIERLAKNLAREVLKTKVDVEMDNMNSYERRVVHSVLADFKNIKTESVGEEPNRHVVIKYDK